MRSPSLSVALCAYNGAKHLPEQLASIAAQTRIPDELVVCDDGSSDMTLSLLETFRASAPFPVHVHRNPINLKSTKNFERAISLCVGDIIALADQDDVWLPRKLETLADCFAANPNLGLAFSDGELVDQDAKPLGRRMWANCPFPAAEQQAFDAGEGPRLLLRFNCVTGAALAFRADLRPHLLPIPVEWVHDAWIGFIAAALADAKTIAEPLLHYRQHAAQQIGLKPLTLAFQLRSAARMDVAYFEKRLACFESLAERLGGAESRLRDPSILTATREKVAHCRRQVELRRRWRLARPLFALPDLVLGRYHEFGRGVKSYLVDAFLG